MLGIKKCKYHNKAVVIDLLNLVLGVINDVQFRLNNCLQTVSVNALYSKNRQPQK
uniref:Uncharacterized protein n=1 Tax=Anguilla anguilla TaxID=7936 RepID=A0A0E9XFK6_ANGAN